MPGLGNSLVRLQLMTSRSAQLPAPRLSSLGASHGQPGTEEGAGAGAGVWAAGCLLGRCA